MSERQEAESSVLEGLEPAVREEGSLLPPLILFSVVLLLSLLMMVVVISGANERVRAAVQERNVFEREARDFSNALSVANAQNTQLRTEISSVKKQNAELMTEISVAKEKERELLLRIETIAVSHLREIETLRRACPVRSTSVGASIGNFAAGLVREAGVAVRTFDEADAAARRAREAELTSDFQRIQTAWNNLLQTSPAAVQAKILPVGFFVANVSGQPQTFALLDVENLLNSPPPWYVRNDLLVTQAGTLQSRVNSLSSSRGHVVVGVRMLGNTPTATLNFISGGGFSTSAPVIVR